SNPALHNDFPAFKETVEETFAVPPLAQKMRAERDLMRLTCQPGKVADFANNFATACSKAEVNDEAMRRLLFVSKLPPSIQEKVLVLQGATTYPAIRDNLDFPR
ncbi:hypothetical protein, partial [Pandoraea sputorum]|uniref:hypothetical protein n=1 Tax=Pandoraea sputorum TaxID=93222 RepID=UPI003558A9EE